MSKYRITVEGKTYEVEIERIDDQNNVFSAGNNDGRQHKNADPVVRVIDPSAGKKTVMQKGIIKAPMPGTIISIKVEVGDTVRKGQPVLVLEAMKMNNEIKSPSDGTISMIHRNKGETVQGGDILIELLSSE